MTLQIREGIFYVTADGQKIGPMKLVGSVDYPWKTMDLDVSDDGDSGSGWTKDGKFHVSGFASELDLVAEWSQPAPQEAGPVRTVTRQEIVPGNYGRLNIKHAIYKRDAEAGDISVVFTDRDGNLGPEMRTLLNADELRAAASIFNSLAEALESQP